jgi:D-alanyl-D-alanine carboxypeptidase
LQRFNFTQIASLCILLLTSVLSTPGRCDNPPAAEIATVDSDLGKHAAVIVADSQGKIFVSKNPDQELIPASILKIFTSLVGLHYLGEDFRYTTEVFIDHEFKSENQGIWRSSFDIGSRPGNMPSCSPATQF